MIMKSAMPSSLELEVLSVSSAISYLKEAGSEDERIFLLAKTPMFSRICMMRVFRYREWESEESVPGQTDESCIATLR